MQHNGYQYLICCEISTNEKAIRIDQAKQDNNNYTYHEYSRLRSSRAVLYHCDGLCRAITAMPESA